MKTFLRSGITTLPYCLTVHFLFKRFILAIAFSGGALLAANGQTITNVTVTGAPVCAGSSLNVSFNANNGGVGFIYNTSTVYTVYLSSVTGVGPYNSIGTITYGGVYDPTPTIGVTSVTGSVVLPPGTSGGNYRVSIGSGTPVYNGSTGTNASAVFGVNALVTPSVTINRTPAGAICAGTNVTFTATPTNGGAAPLYQFKVNGADVGSNSITNTYSSTTLANNDVVTVVMTSNNPCVTTTTATSNSLTILVNPILVPTVTISSSPSPVNICVGTSVTFTAVPINGGTNPPHQWQLSTNGGGSFSDIGGATSPTYISTTLANGHIIRLKLTSTANCASPTIIFSNEITASVSTVPTTANAGTDATVCATTYTLAGNTATVGIGTWTLVSGTGTITSPNSPTSGVTGLGVGANTFRWTIANAPCTASSDNVIITRSDLPTVATAGTDESVCATTYTLAGNTATVGTGNWTLVSGSGIITTPASPTSGVSGLGVGANTFRWTITNAPCTSTSDDVIISRSATPTTATAGSDATVCATTYTLAGNSATVGTGTWTLVSGTGTITSQNSPTSGVTGLGVGANTFRWTIANAPCTATSDDVIITRSDLPTIANAGSDESVCATTYTLAGNTATVGTGNWTLVSGSGTITTPTSPTSAVTGLGAGANTFRWTITNAPCASSSDDVIITRSATPTTATAGTDATVCATTYTLAGNSATVGTGAWTLVSGTGTITSPNSPTSGVTGLGVGANTFRWTIANAPCASTSDDVIITRSDVPTTANAGADQTFCVTTSATLSGNTATIGVGTWTLISGTGAITSPSSPTSGVTGLGAGANTFRWTIANAPCSSTSDDVIITNNQNSTIVLTSVAGTDNQSRCINTAITSITYLVGGGGSGVTVTGLPGGVSGSYNAGTKVYTISGSPDVSGTFNYTLTTTGTCTTNSVSGTLNVFITPAVPPTPTAKAGQLSSICPLKTGLEYSVPASSNITSYNWTVPTGFTITSGAGTNLITVTATTSAVSGNIRVQAINACGTSAFNSTGLAVTVGPFNSVNAGSDTSVCAGTTSYQLVATFDPNSATANNEISWLTPIPNIGTYSPNANRYNPRYDIPASIQNGGTVTLTARAAAEGSCPAVTDQMVLTVLQPHITPTISATSPICAGSPSTVTFTARPNTIITYNVNQTISIGASGTATLTTGNLSANTTYTLVKAAYISNTACSTLVTSSTTIVVTAVAVTTAGTDQIVCSTSPNVTLAGNVSGGASAGTWSGGGGTFTPNNTTFNAVYTPTATEIAAGTVTLTLTSAPAGSCGTTNDAVAITINPAVVTTAGADQTVCSTSPNVTLAGNISGGASTGTWSGGAGTFTPNNATLNAVYTPTAAESTVTLTLTSADPAGPCGSTNDAVIITINPVVLTSAGSDQSVCSTSPDATLAGIISGGASTGAWSGGAGTFTPNNTTLNAVYTPTAAEITAGSVTLTLTSADPIGPCGSTNDAVLITINPVVVTSAGADQSVCSISPNVTLAGNISGGASAGTWSGGAGTFTPNNTTLNAVYTPTAAEITAGTVTLTLTSADPTGPCGSTNDAVDITINPAVVTTAGADQTVCSISPNVTLAGNISGGASTGIWSGGAGTFTPDNTTLNAVYTPTAAEITAGTVTLTLTSADPAGLCGSTNDAVAITITPLVVTAAGADQSVCSTSPNVTLAGNISGGVSTGTWSGGAGTFSPNNNTLNAVYTPTAAEMTAGSVTLTLTSADPIGPCGSTNDAITITINSAATVSAGTNQTICSNNPAILSGNLGGAATSATWSTSGTGTFTNNSPTAQYAPSSADINAGTVTLTYTTDDPSGPCSSVNASMVLTIRKAVLITTQPSNTSVCATANTSFSVVATGDQLSYQWYKGIPGTSTLLPGATGSTLSFTPATVGDNGTYFVIIGGATECSAVTSEVKSLNVDQSIFITDQPDSYEICQNGTVTFTVDANAGSDPLTYQWRKGGTNITGAIGTSFTITSVSLTDAGSYDVVISGPAGFTCPTINSSAAMLTVTPLTVGGTITGATNVCAPTNTSILTLSGNVGSVIRWESSTDNFGAVINAISNTTTSLTAINLTTTTSYRAIVKNGVCTQAESNIFTITVNPTPVPDAVSNQLLCNGAQTTLISFTSNTPAVGTSYTWTNSASTIGLAAGGSTSSIAAFTATNATANTVIANLTVTPSYTNGGATCIGSALPFSITVYPTPILTSTLTPTAVCSNAPFNYSATSATSSVNFSWIRAAVPGISNPAGSGGSSAISETLINATAAPINVVYAFTLSANGCTNSQNVTVTVNPTPLINSTATPAPVCSGATFSYTATSLTNGTTFSWTRAVVAGISNGIGSGATASISETLTNTTAAPIDVVYSYILSANGCSNPQTVTVSVKPSPILSNAATAISICNNTLFTYTATSATTGTTFSWTRAAVTGINNTAGSGSNENVSETLVNSTTAPVNVVYIFTLVADGCMRTQNVTVTVNPNIILTSSAAPPSVCSGLPFNYNATSATTGVAFSWTRAVVSGISNPAAGGTGAAISETLINTTSSPVNVIYVYTLAVNGCSNTQNITVTVNPTPLLSSTATPAPICSNNTFTYTATATVTGTTFSWTRAAVTGISNIAGSGNTANISETLINTTTAPINVVYAYTLVASGCSTLQNVTVVVNPSPSLSSTLTPTAVCSSSPFAYTATSGTIGTTFSWTRAAVAGISNAAGSGGNETVSETLINTTLSNVNVIYIFTISANGCTRTQNVTVGVKPVPVLTTSLLDSACSASAPTILLSASVPSSYSWTVGTVTGGILGATGGSSPANINQNLTNPSTTDVGSVQYLVTPTSNPGGCAGAPVTITVNVYPPTVGGTVNVNDSVVPTTVKLICPSPPSNIKGFVRVSNKVGEITGWQRSTNNFLTFTPMTQTTDTVHYFSLAQTTAYRAVIQSGSCGVAYSQIAIISVVPPSPPSPVMANPTTICVGDTSTLTAGVGYGTNGISAGSGDFNNANPAGWCVDNDCSGSVLPANGDNTQPKRWAESNGPKVFSLIEYDSPDKKFAIVDHTSSSMTTPVFSLFGLPTANLSFITAFNMHPGAVGYVEISTDGGANYIAPPLRTYSGTRGITSPHPNPPNNTPTTGEGIMSPENISLNAYVGLSNLKIRFRFITNPQPNPRSTWALDNVLIPNTGMPAAFNWSQTTQLAQPSLIPPPNSTTVYANPTVTTTYQIQTQIGGCPGGVQSVTVNVNPLPVIVPMDTVICFNTSVQTTSIRYNNVQNAPETYTIRWETTPANTFSSVSSNNSGTISPNAQGNGFIPITIPAGTGSTSPTSPITYRGWLKVRNNSNGIQCRSDSSDFTITINPKPIITVINDTVCNTASAALLPYTASSFATKYSISWTSAPGFNGVPDTDLPTPASGSISVPLPSGVTAGTYTGNLLVKTASGCISNVMPFAIVVEAPANLTSQPTTSPICLHSPAIISAPFTGTSVTGTWERSINGGAYAPLSSTAPYNINTTPTSSTLTISSASIDMIDHQFQFRLQSTGSCAANVTSVATPLKIMHVWMGRVSSDWQNKDNWSDSVLPNRRCDTVHILNRANDPTLQTDFSSIKNLLIYDGGYFTLAKHATAYIKISRSIVVQPTGSFNALDGRIVLNGGEFAVAENVPEPLQDLKGSYFVNHIVKHLTIRNPLGARVVPQTPLPEGSWSDTLNISYHLNFESVSNTIFAGNNNLTLMSRAGADNTASVGVLNSPLNNSVSGDVIVERYLPPEQAWRFLATPVQEKYSIYDTWQESGKNPPLVPGYGTRINGPEFPNGGTGFDRYSQRPSMKHFIYDMLDIGYKGVTNTITTPLTNAKGYMIFVRGDRSVDNASNPANATILRARGNLITGTQNYSVRAMGDTSIGNPFASRLDLKTLFTGVTGVNATVAIWDPFLAGSFGEGGFRQYTREIGGAGNFVQVPGGIPLDYIESGQAFFIQSTNGGAFNINENAKAIGSLDVSRGGGLPEAKLYTNLFNSNANGTTKLVDGTLINTDLSYLNTLDNMDVRKYLNVGENLTIASGGKDLNVERRKPFVESDTIRFTTWNLKQQQYKFEFVPENLSQPEMTGYLEDLYTRSSTEVSLVQPTTISFTVTNVPASYSADRFRLVFKRAAAPAPPVPAFTFTEVKASRNADRSVAVGWKVSNEVNIQKYTVERSVDGINFTGILTNDGTNSTAYAKTDLSPLASGNFYRIKATTYVGQDFFSQVVKVEGANGTPSSPGFSVYPNPVQNSKLQIKFTDKPKGDYRIVLANKLGQVVFSGITFITGSTEIKTFNLSGGITSGVYQLSISEPGNTRYTQQVFIE